MKISVSLLSIGLCISLNGATVVPLTPTLADGVTPVTNGASDTVGGVMGTWSVTPQTYTASPQRIHGGGGAVGGSYSSNYTYPDGTVANEVDGPNRGVRITLFDAVSDSADFVVINSETGINMTVTETFDRIEFRPNTGATGSYDMNISFTYGSFSNGNVTTGQVLTATPSTWEISDYTNTSGANEDITSQGIFDGDPVEIIPGGSVNFTTTAPGVYDGSTYNSFIQRRTNWQPQNAVSPGGAQMHHFSSVAVSGDDYVVEYTAYTFVPVPEPTQTSLLTLGLASLFIRRQRNG